MISLLESFISALAFLKQAVPGVWFAEIFAGRNQDQNLIRRSKEAILHRMRILLAKTIRESLGRK